MDTINGMSIENLIKDSRKIKEYKAKCEVDLLNLEFNIEQNALKVKDIEDNKIYINQITDHISKDIKDLQYNFDYLKQYNNLNHINDIGNLFKFNISVNNASKALESILRRI